MSEAAVSDGTTGAEHLAVRVFRIAADDAHRLVERIALVLGEPMAAEHELHLTYGTPETGCSTTPGARASGPRTPSSSSSTPRYSRSVRRRNEALAASGEYAGSIKQNCRPRCNADPKARLDLPLGRSSPETWQRFTASRSCKPSRSSCSAGGHGTARRPCGETSGRRRPVARRRSIGMAPSRRPSRWSTIVRRAAGPE